MLITKTQLAKYPIQPVVRYFSDIFVTETSLTYPEMDWLYASSALWDLNCSEVTEARGKKQSSTRR